VGGPEGSGRSVGGKLVGVDIRGNVNGKKLISVEGCRQWGVVSGIRLLNLFKGVDMGSVTRGEILGPGPH